MRKSHAHVTGTNDSVLTGQESVSSLLCAEAKISLIEFGLTIACAL